MHAGGFYNLSTHVARTGGPHIWDMKGEQKPRCARAEYLTGHCLQGAHPSTRASQLFHFNVNLRSVSSQFLWSIENIYWFWCLSFLFAKIAPDHVVPAPEECYVYSPLGSAYKLQSYTEGYGKNTSLVTMWVELLLEVWTKLCMNENNCLFSSVLIKMFEEPNFIFLLLLLFQLYDLEYHDGNIYTKYSLGHKTGNIYFLVHFYLKTS